MECAIDLNGDLVLKGCQRQARQAATNEKCLAGAVPGRSIVFPLINQITIPK